MAKKSDEQELRRLIGLAEEQGWRVEKTQAGHWAFYPKDKRRKPVHTGSSPSDYRAFKNLRAELRRSGLKDEPEHRKVHVPPKDPEEPMHVEPPHEAEPLDLELREHETIGACEAAVYVRVRVPEQMIETPVEFESLADVDLLALLRGAQAELVRRYESAGPRVEADA